MQVEMVYHYLSQVVENVYHVIQGDGATAPTVDQMTAVATAFKNWENVTAKAEHSNSLGLYNILVKDLTSRDAPAIDYQTGLPIQGANVGQALPGNVTVAIKWETGFRGRSFRGRTYHVGMTATQVLGDQLVVGTQASLLAIYRALIADVFAVPGCELGVVSYASHNAWRAAGLFTPIIDCSINADLDSQRRRLAGRGT